MGVIKNLRSILPIPRSWQGEEQKFGIRISDAITELFNRTGRSIPGDYIPMEEKGAAGGVAELNSNGKVPATQLPSYVDDVVEYSSVSDFPATGESGKIYVARDTNKDYRWSGTTYVELSKYDEATQSASGLMSATDKTKLDGIATGATANVVSNSLTDTSTTNALSAAKGKELNDGKLDKDQGTTSSGKVMRVGSDGALAPDMETYLSAYHYDSSYASSGNYRTCTLAARFTDYNLLNYSNFILVIPSDVIVTNSGKSVYFRLNVNSTGSKSLYIDDVLYFSNIKTLYKGVYFVYYDGSYYKLRTDGIKVNKINGYSVGAAVEKGVDTSITASTTSTNLPTSTAVKNFAEGRYDRITNIAPEENGSTATAAHDEGSYIMRSGVIYKVIADIAVGDSFVVNTNVATIPDGLASELTELANAGITVSFTIPANGWSVNSPYVYTWTSSHVTTSCVVEVEFDDDVTGEIPYLSYEKTTGGILFTAPSLPTVGIPVNVHITNVQESAVTSVSGDMVSTDVITGASNVDEALIAVNSKKANAKYFSLSSSDTTKTINIPSGASGMLFSTGAGIDRSGIYGFTAKSDGSIILDTLYSTSVHTINTSTNNKITITTSVVVRYMIMQIYGDEITI